MKPPIAHYFYFLLSFSRTALCLPVRVLIVDDSRPMRMIVSRALRQSGRRAEVVEASDGADALAKLSTGPVDLVLSDWNMPVMNGLEFLSEFRERDKMTPFVFITTEWTPEQRALAKARGASALLDKPFTADLLDEVLTQAGI